MWMWRLLVLQLALVAWAAGQGAGQKRGVGPRARICYVADWSRSYLPRYVDPSLCGIIMYAFGRLKADGTLVEAEYPGKPDKLTLAGIAQFKKNARIGLSIGGWAEGSERFSAMVSSNTTRKAFIDSVLRAMELWDLSAVELAWISPTMRGGVATDRSNYVELVKELAAALRSNCNSTSLGVAIPVADGQVDNAFDVKQLAEHADWLLLQGYDLHGHWESFSGVNAPLFSQPGDNQTVNYWLQHLLSKAPADRIVLSTPAFGRTWTLTDSPVPGGLGSASDGALFSDAGMMAYNEVCPDFGAEEEERVWTRQWDSVSKTPYAVRNTARNRAFVSYDDAPSIRAKAEFAVENGLAGVALFTIDNDDYAGACGVTYPLLRALNQVMTDAR